MESKIKELFEKLKGSEKGLKILIAAGLAGVLLIMLSELIPPRDNNAQESITEDYTYSEYISSLEEKTESLLSSINGAGRCKVMITLSDTNESVFAKNTEENQSDSSYSKNDEYVLYEEDGSKAPVLVKQYFPEIRGIAIVCDGADNEVVRENIFNSVSSLYGIPVTKISVSKYKS